MALVNNCHLPEELYYWVEKHVWVRPDGGGPVTIGMTDVAQHLAGSIVAATPKRAGRTVQKGQSVATIESSKWVGPVPSPLTGEIVAVNEALRQTPGLLNQAPYEAGWIVKLRPAKWDEERAALVTGPEGVEAYRQLLDAEGIRCGEQPAACERSGP